MADIEHLKWLRTLPLRKLIQARRAYEEAYIKHEGIEKDFCQVLVFKKWCLTWIGDIPERIDDLTKVIEEKIK